MLVKIVGFTFLFVYVSCHAKILGRNLFQFYYFQYQRIVIFVLTILGFTVVIVEVVQHFGDDFSHS